MTIDLFRPFMAPDAGARVAETLSPDARGRIYCGEGAKVKQFEHGLGELIGSPIVPLAFSSCTAALEMALYLCDVKGGEVISTPITCTATNAAIVRAGARIVWADVDPVTGLIDPEDVARKANPYTRAVMVVDWGGRAGSAKAVRGWLPLYDRMRAPVIQDAAHSLLAADNRVPWRIGEYVAYSFGPIKHLTCGGHGGALLTPPEQRDRARQLRWYGFDREDSKDFRCQQDIKEIGWKAHLTDVDASIGLANLPYAAWVVERYRDNARYYQTALAGVPGLRLPPWDEGSSYWLYDVLTESETERDSLAAYLAEQGIETSRVHRRNDTLPALHGYVINYGMYLPGVEAFDSRHLAIPVGYHVTEAEREQVAEAIRAWAKVEVKV